jgi:hypothetical protein
VNAYSANAVTRAMYKSEAYNDDGELFLPPNFFKKAFPETMSALIFVVAMWFLYQRDESVPNYRS